MIISGTLAVFLLHLMATISLTAIAWVHALIHYPLFIRVGRKRFPRYHQGFVLLAGLVIGPLMILEATTALLLVGFADRLWPAWFHITGIMPLLVIWYVTLFQHRFLHRRIARGFHPETLRKMLCAQWVRTAGWSLRTIVVIAMQIALFRSLSQ